MNTKALASITSYQDLPALLELETIENTAIDKDLIMLLFLIIIK